MKKYNIPEKKYILRKDIIICGSPMFSSEMIAILNIYINYWFNGGHFGIYPKTRLSPKWIRVGFYRSLHCLD